MESVLGEFLTTQREALHNLQDAEIAAMAAAIIQSLEDPPTTYAEEADQFYGSIKSGLPFDWTAQIVQELRRATASDVLDAAERWLFCRKQRRSVSVMLFGASIDHRAELKALKTGAEGGRLSGVVGIAAADAAAVVLAAAATTTSTAAVATCRACITPHCTTTWTTTARIHPGALQHHRHLLLTHGGHVEPLKGHCQRRPLCGVEPGLVACLTKPRPVRVDEMPQRRKLVPRRARELLGIVFPVRH